jgi:hypothetical protein
MKSKTLIIAALQLVENERHTQFHHFQQFGQIHANEPSLAL